MKRKAYCFDIDGTLANNYHRQHFLRGEKRDWKSFFSLQHMDEPYEAVIRVFNALKAAGYYCFLLTGRDEEFHKDTLEWLRAQEVDMDDEDLFMRPHGDRTNDDDLKLRMLREIEEQKNIEVIGIFDDRVRIIMKLRDAGYYVFECNETREEF